MSSTKPFGTAVRSLPGKKDFFSLLKHVQLAELAGYVQNFIIGNAMSVESYWYDSRVEVAYNMLQNLVQCLFLSNSSTLCIFLNKRNQP